MTSAEIDVGIVTALAVECAAVHIVLDELTDEPAAGDPNLYGSGLLPSRDPAQPHRVVVALQAHDGTRSAAALCTDMARSFPGLRCIVMCGIAAGVPDPHAAERDVRLGDIVSATGGVVDYDHVRTVNGRDVLRRPTDGLSKALLRADRVVQTKEFTGSRPWLNLINGEDRLVPAKFARPRDRVVRPGARGRPDTAPRVHRGPIGSADRLVRDAGKRDEIATRYGVRAVEMEASGIAVGADLHGLHWYVVRGIADYADAAKDDRWHPYAALAAAAYTRVLLAECPPFGPARVATGSARETTGSSAGLIRIVDALLSIRAMQDDYQRRAVLATLPDRIRTAVPDNNVARLHVIATVRTCQDFPDGRDALLQALRLTLGPESPELQRVEPILRANWSAR